MTNDNRAEFQGGGVRDSEDGKPDFSLLWPKDVPYKEQFLYKLAMHMTKGAEKYEPRNWEKFHDQDALDRAVRSKMRHHTQDVAGETDENHNIAEAANCMFVETIKWKVQNNWLPSPTNKAHFVPLYCQERSPAGRQCIEDQGHTGAHADMQQNYWPLGHRSDHQDSFGDTWSDS